VEGPRTSKITVRQWAEGRRWIARTVAHCVSTKRIYVNVLETSLLIIGSIPLSRLRRADMHA
jgi:hypothetical protein